MSALRSVFSRAYKAVSLELWVCQGVGCLEQLCPKLHCLGRYVFWTVFQYCLGLKGLELKFLPDLKATSQMLSTAVFLEGLFPASISSNDAWGQNSYSNGLPSLYGKTLQYCGETWSLHLWVWSKDIWDPQNLFRGSRTFSLSSLYIQMRLDFLTILKLE